MPGIDECLSQAMAIAGARGASLLSKTVPMKQKRW